MPFRATGRIAARPRSSCIVATARASSNSTKRARPAQRARTSSQNSTSAIFVCDLTIVGFGRRRSRPLTRRVLIRTSTPRSLRASFSCLPRDDMAAARSSFRSARFSTKVRRIPWPRVSCRSRRSSRRRRKPTQRSRCRDLQRSGSAGTTGSCTRRVSNASISTHAWSRTRAHSWPGACTSCRAR
jgi:hypothetical protein